MSATADLQRYAIWGGVVAFGAVLAMFDRRYVLAALLVVVALAGVATTRMSPFTFHGGDYYMQGVIAAGGALLALAGYALVVIWKLVRPRMGGGGKP